MRIKNEYIFEIHLGWLTPLLLIALGFVLLTQQETSLADSPQIPYQTPLSNPSPILGSYYLSKSQYDGVGAINACEAGFKMATLWEILDTSILHYDTSLGYQPASGDAGMGPPSGEVGWVRSGGVASIGSGAGNGNCAVWTYNVAGSYGTVIALPNNWTTPGSSLGVWLADYRECNTRQRVWCFRSPVDIFLPVVYR
jgi:hypothetical protein